MVGMTELLRDTVDTERPTGPGLRILKGILDHTILAIQNEKVSDQEEFQMCSSPTHHLEVQWFPGQAPWPDSCAVSGEYNHMSSLNYREEGPFKS